LLALAYRLSGREIPLSRASALRSRDVASAYLLNGAEPSRGGIRFIAVGAMPLPYHRTKLSTIVNGDCRAARPASPPNQRMNPTLLFLNRQVPVESVSPNIPPFVRQTRQAGYPPRISQNVCGYAPCHSG